MISVLVKIAILIWLVVQTLKPELNQFAWGAAALVFTIYLLTSEDL